MSAKRRIARRLGEDHEAVETRSAQPLWAHRKPQELCDEVRTCRAKKCYDTKYVNLFIRVKEGTESAEAWVIMRRTIASHWTSSLSVSRRAADHAL